MEMEEEQAFLLGFERLACKEGKCGLKFFATF